MTKRPITFPKTSDGVWTNGETGVIVRLELDGSGYRPMRPTQRGSWIGISVAVRTLAEAKHKAARYIDGSFRHTIGEAYTEALAEHIDRAEAQAAAAGLPTWRADDARRQMTYASAAGAEYWYRATLADIAVMGEAVARSAAETDAALIDEAHDKAPAEEHTRAELRASSDYYSREAAPLCLRADGRHVAHMRAADAECRDDQDEYVAQVIAGSGERVEIGADGCGCLVTAEITANGADVEGTERVDHRDNCWNRFSEGDVIVHKDPMVDTRHWRIDSIRRSTGLPSEMSVGLSLHPQTTVGETRTSMYLSTIVEYYRVVAPPLPPAPADVNDDTAWAAYCAALPTPTTDEAAAVLAEYGDPYADEMAMCRDGFRENVRMLWGMRERGTLNPTSYKTLRGNMAIYRMCMDTYRGLARSWAMRTLAADA